MASLRRFTLGAILAYSSAAVLGQEPQRIYCASPVYPVLARQARIAGTVALDYTIGRNGEPAAVEIVSGHPLLTRAAKDNFLTWRFSRPGAEAMAEKRRIHYVFEFSEEAVDGYYNPKDERVTFEGIRLVRIRTAPSGTHQVKDCPDFPVLTPRGPVAPCDFVALRRSGCYGTCPSYEVKLFGDGRVLWTGHYFVEASGERSYTIGFLLAEKIIQRFRSPEVLGLCGDYSQSITDSATVVVEISSSTVRKTIRDYAASSPAWFQQLQVELDAVARTHDQRHGDPATEPLIHIQEEYLPNPGMTGLMRAAARSDLATVRKLISSGVSLEDVDASGWTALMYAAASYSSGGALDELLRVGANRSHRSPFGDTPLMAAALKGYWDEDLAQGGPEIINAQNRDGVTALMLLAAGGRREEIRAALKAGANAQLRDKLGRTAVDYFDAPLCYKTLVRGYKSHMEITGPCRAPDRDQRKTAALLVSAAKKK